MPFEAIVLHPSQATFVAVSHGVFDHAVAVGSHPTGLFFNSCLFCRVNMPRESPAVSDDANVDEKNQKKNDVKASKSKGDLESESEGNNEDGDNEEAEEEEYEIEEILQAKKGIFGGVFTFSMGWRAYCLRLWLRFTDSGKTGLLREMERIWAE